MASLLHSTSSISPSTKLERIKQPASFISPPSTRSSSAHVESATHPAILIISLLILALWPSPITSPIDRPTTIISTTHYPFHHSIIFILIILIFTFSIISFLFFFQVYIVRPTFFQPLTTTIWSTRIKTLLTLRSNEIACLHQFGIKARRLLKQVDVAVKSVITT